MNVRRIRIVGFFALIMFGALLLVGCGDERDGYTDVDGNYIECYRIYLSESTQTVEGYAITVPINSAGSYHLKTEDGVVTVKNTRSRIDAVEKITCDVLDW